MKKLILALLAVATVYTAEAQKGTILTYGTAGLHTMKNDNGGGNDTKDFNWNINPGVGYQFTDNITVGLQGGYMSMRNTANTQTNPLANTTVNAERIRKSNEWQAGVFFRYGMRISKLFTLYDQIDANYLAGRTTTDITTTTTTTNPATTTTVTAPQVVNGDYTGFQARLFPALMVHVKDGMALNFSFGGLQYRTVSTDVPGGSTTTTSSFDLTLWQQMNFGISYNFGKGCCKGKGPGNPNDDLRPMKMDADQDDDDE